MKDKINQDLMQPWDQVPNREGFAMVTTLLMVLVLAVLAVGVVWMASSEKKTTSAEQVHISSLFSADAGGEAGINFIRLSATPPRVTTFSDSTVNVQGETSITGTQTYDYRCKFLKKSGRNGWQMEYLNYNYQINSNGHAGASGESGVQLMVSRLYREGQ